jgi:hypothetical protein
MLEMDIKIIVVVPHLSSGINLGNLADYILTSNPDFHDFAQTEVTFRFNCDVSLFSYGAFSWPFFSFTSNNKTHSLHSTLSLPETTHVQTIQNQNPQNNIDNHNIQNPIDHGTEPFSKLPQPQPQPQPQPRWVQDSCLSIKNGNTELCKSGVGGTYFVYDSIITNGNEAQNMSSVFKPTDEEPGAPNNPKQNPPSFVPMMPWGGGSHREVAAFKLDKGFVGVPETHLVEISNNEGTKKRISTKVCKE